MQHHGQTLVIHSPVPGGSSPKGSLSNRFAKIAQSRQKAGVVVVGSAGIESRPGKTLGLGFSTGIPPSQFQAAGQRISTSRGSGPGLQTRRGQAATIAAAAGGGRGLAGMPTTSIGRGGKILGIQTPAGLARAMQERGGGASEDLLVNPDQPIIRESRGPARRRGPPLRGPGARGATTDDIVMASPREPRALQQRNSTRQTRPSPYATAAAASRRGRGAKTAVPRPQISAASTRAQPTQSKTGSAAAAAAAAGGKGKKAKPKAKKATPDSLDSDLTAYMMKHESTASAMLDTDLDTYMADRPDEITF